MHNTEEAESEPCILRAGPTALSSSSVDRPQHADVSHLWLSECGQIKLHEQGAYMWFKELLFKCRAVVPDSNFQFGGITLKCLDDLLVPFISVTFTCHLETMCIVISHWFLYFPSLILHLMILTLRKMHWTFDTS